jgi:hypothetical protein
MREYRGRLSWISQYLSWHVSTSFRAKQGEQSLARKGMLHKNMLPRSIIETLPAEKPETWRYRGVERLCMCICLYRRRRRSRWGRVACPARASRSMVISRARPLFERSGSSRAAYAEGHGSWKLPDE